MSQTKFVVGIDFGSESGRAVLIDIVTGQEVASAVSIYAHGVIDEQLPGTDIILEPDWASLSSIKLCKKIMALFTTRVKREWVRSVFCFYLPLNR